MEKKKFVIIQSNIRVRVNPGLLFEDVSNLDAHIPDRLKVNPRWPKMSVTIRPGQHTYPAEIVEWNAVKSLQAQGLLTIGTFVDEADAETANEKRTLSENLKNQEKIELANAIKMRKKHSLEEAAEA